MTNTNLVIDESLFNPSLRQALAVAIVARRRRDDVVQEHKARVDELQRELDCLKASAAAAVAAAPMPAAHMSQILAQQQQQAVSQQDLGLSQASLMEAQMAALAMWAHASVGPGNDGEFVAALQHYILQRDVGAGPLTSGRPMPAAPTTRLLQHTPMTAALELLSDLLSTVPATAALSGPAEPGVPQDGSANAPCAAALAEHVLQRTCACLGMLASMPGEASSPEDFAALQEFVGMLLAFEASALPAAGPLAAAAACVTGQPGSAHPAVPGHFGLTGAPGAQQSGSDGRLSECRYEAAQVHRAQQELAQRVLQLLCEHASTGMVVLGCTAVAGRHTMERLVAAVTGEPLARAASQQPPPHSDASITTDSGAGGEAVEALLAEAFMWQAALLQQGLRALPEWMAELGVEDDAFMQNVAVAVMGASDACQLVSLSHPDTARHMQRVSVQLINALHHIANTGQPAGS